MHKRIYIIIIYRLYSCVQVYNMHILYAQCTCTSTHAYRGHSNHLLRVAQQFRSQPSHTPREHPPSPSPGNTRYPTLRHGTLPHDLRTDCPVHSSWCSPDEYRYHLELRRERGRDGGRERWREGGRERGRERGREGGRGERGRGKPVNCHR